MVSIARVGLPQTGDVIYKQLLGANTLGTTIALIFRVTWEIPVSGAGRAAESDLGLQMLGSKLMKRMLCSLVLVFVISTMGLLVGSKNASADPVTFAELEEVLQNSEWEGTWEENEYFNSGPAKLSLTMMGADVVYVEFQMFDTGMGDYTFDVSGTINGNAMTLTTRRSKTVLRLSQERGVWVLKGDYNVFGGAYAGETGSYYFKKKG